VPAAGTSAARVAALEDNGYTILPQVLNQQEVLTLREHLQGKSPDHAFCHLERAPARQVT
jgi:hypothetical protein